MSAVRQRTKTGPRSYTPGEAVNGGQVLEGHTGNDRAWVAGAGSLRVLGVALTDAVNPEAISQTPATVNGRPVLNAALLPDSVAVADSGIETEVTYAAAAQFGDRLIAAAGGNVTPAGATPDARTIVGKCSQPGGVAAGARGLMTTA